MKYKPWNLQTEPQKTETTGLKKKRAFICSHVGEPEPCSTKKSTCFQNSELCMPCSQGILYVASRKQKCTHVFTKEMEVLNGKVNSPKHIIHCYKCHVFNTYYFSLKYCKYLFPVFFLATLAGGCGTKTFCAPTCHSGGMWVFWDVHLQEIK